MLFLLLWVYNIVDTTAALIGPTDSDNKSSVTKVHGLPQCQFYIELDDALSMFENVHD